MRDVEVILFTKSLPEDEYTYRVEVVFENDQKVSEKDLEKMSLAYYSLAGKTTRFDPDLGKNVTEILTGDEKYETDIQKKTIEGNKLNLDISHIPTRNKFTLQLENLQITNDNVVKVINEEADQFSFEHFDNGIVSFDYRLYLPENLDSAEKIPLVLSLHGSGESADRCNFDNRTHLTTNRLGLSFTTEQWQKEHPCVVIMPQFPSLDASYETSNYHAAYIELITSFLEKGIADENRIYGATLSMGSRIMYHFLAEYPDFFAGIILNCGNPMDSELGNLKKLPIQLVHIENDNIVMTNFAKESYQKLLEVGNTNARLTLYPFEMVERLGLPDAHWSWSIQTEELDKLEWLFSQDKSNSTVVNPEHVKGGKIIVNQTASEKQVLLPNYMPFVPLMDIIEKLDCSCKKTTNGFEVSINKQKLLFDTKERTLQKNNEEAVELYGIKDDKDYYVRYDTISSFLDCKVELSVDTAGVNVQIYQENLGSEKFKDSQNNDQSMFV
ncbi:PHB depolymerase family esterase [Enterococcus sp. AZ109]|uniref:carboxylesterase family protein n=1 Tax=Enterococcus sp. AZ109 TaxID=2774634 RepID=UPI003F25129D